MKINHKGTIPLKSSRLLLRKYSLLDSKSMYENYAFDERVTRFLSWTPYKSANAIIPFLNDIIQGYSTNKFYHWAIEYEEKIIGSISITSLDDKNAACEIGYCIGFDYWNQGIMSEALKLVVNYLFSEIHIHRIMAKHDADNMASGKVMMNAGMKYEGTFRGFYLRNNGTIGDALIYGITAEDYISSTAQ